MPGGGNQLYYEFARPGAAVAYVQLAKNVPAGTPHTLVVQEVAGAPNTWQVVVDGHVVSDPILLPGSSGMLTPIAEAESVTRKAACNSYGYRFDNLVLTRASMRAWHPPLRSYWRHDQGTQLQTGLGFFVASSA